MASYSLWIVSASWLLQNLRTKDWQNYAVHLEIKCSPGAGSISAPEK